MFGLIRVIRYEVWQIVFNDDRKVYFKSEVDMLRELVSLRSSDIAYYGRTELSFEDVKAIFGKDDLDDKNA